MTQTRVGTTLLWTESQSVGEGGVDQDVARDLATVLAERARQTRNGDAISAVLDD